MKFLQDSLQAVELALEVLQVVAQGDEARDDVGLHVGAAAVLVDNLLRSGNLEATHLDEVVDEAYLLDVLFRILAHLVGALGLGLQVGELGLPEAKRALVEVEHLGHLSDGVVELQVFVQIEGHGK